MTFTFTGADGEVITWTDGELTGTAGAIRMIQAEARYREENDIAVEFPPLYCTSGPRLLKDPYAAFGLMRYYFAGREYEVSGDLLGPPPGTTENEIN
jgi:hypothetical protein